MFKILELINFAIIVLENRIVSAYIKWEINTNGNQQIIKSKKEPSSAEDVERRLFQIRMKDLLDDNSIQSDNDEDEEDDSSDLESFDMCQF